jgi:1,4-dihydroxy-2-naphthoate octaprenyltransferase
MTGAIDTAAPALEAAPPRWKAFVLAARPKTLAASVGPVLLGSALAYHRGAFDLRALLAALLAAVSIQIGTNLANDYFDHQKGADLPDRIGPARATAMGWLSPGTVALGAGIAFGFAALLGLLLVALGGWPIAAIGLSGIAAGIAYTGGPFPLAYLGLGEPFVFLYFGLFAVVGTVLVHGVPAGPDAWAAGAALGALSCAILVVNNLRDHVQDLRAQKRTLAVRLGPRFARLEYVALIAVAYLAAVTAAAVGAAPRGWWLVLATLPLAARRVLEVLRLDGAALNPVLGTTARLGLVFALALAAGSLL